MGFDNFLRATDPHSPAKVFSSVPDNEFSSAAPRELPAKNDERACDVCIGR
jgi:hypothetical protein